MKNLISKLQRKIQNSNDFLLKKLKISNIYIYTFYNETLTNSTYVSEFILKRLSIINKSDLNNLENIISGNIKIISDEEIFYYASNGFIVIITNNKIYAVEARATLDRGVTNCVDELSLKGPKDAFSENYNINLGLIRRRIKTPKLKCLNMEIGRLTKTKIGILYIEGIVNKQLIEQIKLKLSTIDIDGILDVTYLKENLESKNHSFFPTIISTERPDRVCMALLDGKASIIIDTSPYALIMPNFFIDFFHTVDDYYQKPINITFIRLIRLFAFFIAIFVPALYIMITTHNYNLVDLDILLSLKAQRMSVPISAVSEALLMMIAFEILRESDIRMSATSGNAVSILGGLILGDAAVSAGIISPIMIIVIAISAISGLVFSSIELVSAIRWWRFIMIIISALFGLDGIIIGLILLLFRLITIKSFGKHYLAPFIPLNIKELKDSFIKTNNKGEKYRNSLLTNNIKRGHYR